TDRGGASDLGTVFRVTTNGTLTTLAHFNNSNGAYPRGALALGPDGNFYGTTESGANNGDPFGHGTVFRVTSNGILATLAWFSGTNGEHPLAGLVLGPDGSFYGTTLGGGSIGYGTVFKVTTNGELTLLASLTSTIGNPAWSELVLGNDGSF